MTLTREVIIQVERLLQSGRKEDAISLLKSSSSLSSREAKAIAQMVDEDMRRNLHTRPPYVSTEMDGPLKAEAARFLIGKRDIVAAIRYIRENRSVSVSECIDLLNETRDQFGSQYKHRGRRPMPFAGVGRLILIPIAIGISFLLFAGYKYYHQQKLLDNSERVSGTVVDMDVMYRVGSAPLIEYNWNGELRTYQSTIYSYPSPYEIGEEVYLFINRNDSDEVILDTFTDRWSTFSIFALLGGGFLLASAAVSFVSIRHGKNRS